MIVLSSSNLESPPTCQALSCVHPPNVFTMTVRDVSYECHLTAEESKAEDKGTQTNSVAELPLNPGLSGPYTGSKVCCLANIHHPLQVKINK